MLSLDGKGGRTLSSSSKVPWEVSVFEEPEEELPKGHEDTSSLQDPEGREGRYARLFEEVVGWVSNKRNLEVC